MLVVSFSDRAAVLRWLAETGCPFPVLLDPRRQLYTALGLPTDLRKVRFDFMPEPKLCGF